MTTLGQGLSRIRTDEETTLDQQIEEVLLNTSIGDVVKGSEMSSNFKTFFVCRLVVDAVFGQEIRTIKQLASRLDGLTPKDTEIDQYKTRLGDCLNEILDYENQSDLEVQPQDNTLLAIGKTIAFLSLTPAKQCKTPEQKNTKEAAVAIILERCGGRKTTPLKGKLDTVYKAPEWLTGSKNA